MAYDYLGISNKVLRSFGEVVFADATEFTNATGFHQVIKDGVNEVLAEIYMAEDNEWPFQHTETTQVLTIGDETYTIPSDAAAVDWDSFYIDKVYGDEDDFTSVTADSGTKTFTIAGGSFVTAGFATGMKVRWGDVTDNSDSDVTINTLTATVMTVDETVTDVLSADTSFSVTNAFTSPDSKKLVLIDIDTYRNNYLPTAKNVKETASYAKPVFIARNSDNSYILGPSKPNATYLVRYDYFQELTELSASTDVPDIPERYEKVILDGVKAIGNAFRDNVELEARFEKRFQDGINTMRRNLIPQTDSLRYIV
jgi:hypothetical protein